MTLLLIVKVSVLFTVALAVAVTARRATADMRHKALAAAQLAALALPIPVVSQEAELQGFFRVIRFIRAIRDEAFFPICQGFSS